MKVSCLVALAVVGPALAAPTAVPMRLVGDQPAVEVRIGEEGPFLFLIDTGAAGAGRISRKLAERLKLEVSGEVLAGDPSGQHSERRELVGVPRLTVGSRTWRELDFLLGADEREPPGIDGILGFALFAGDLLTLDYPAGELRVEPGELPAPDGGEIIPFRAEHGIPTIDIDVAGTQVPADVDSGSMGWLMLPEEIALGLPLGESKVVGRARTPFNEFEIKQGPLRGVVRIGRHSLENPPIEFASMFPRANIGGQLLRQFALTFDQKHGRLRIAREGDAPIRRAARYRVGIMLAAGPEGLVVQETVAGSPAARAGLQAGDQILRVDGKPIEELPEGAAQAAFAQPEPVELVVRRGEEQLVVRVRPELAE